MGSHRELPTQKLKKEVEKHPMERKTDPWDKKISYEVYIFSGIPGGQIPESQQCKSSR